MLSPIKLLDFINQTQRCHRLIHIFSIRTQENVNYTKLKHSQLNQCKYKLCTYYIICKFNKNSKKEMNIILFSPQFIDVSIVNNFDHEKHILVQKKNNEICSVIKQAQKVREIFDTFAELLKIPTNYVVSYSSKQKPQLYKNYSAINVQVADKIIYINIDKNKFSNIKANRAILYSQNQIGYGEGYSQANVKDQLRLVIQCALNIYEPLRFVIFQKNQDEIKILKKQGFSKIINELNKNQLLRCISQNQKNDLIQQMDQNNEQKSKTIIEQIQKFPFCKKYLQLLSQAKTSKTVKVINTKQGEQKLQLTILQHNLAQVMTQKTLQIFLTTPKSYFDIIPKTSVRNPNSRQISSFIFRNYDNKLYIAKSQKTKQIGGEYYEQTIQNRQFISLLSHVICKQVLSVPHQKTSCLMKNSLIKSYETKKGVFTIKPYMQNIQTLEKLINFQTRKQQKERTIANQIFNEGTIFGQHIQGFGQILLISFVCNQNLSVKSLLEQVSLVKIQAKNTFQYFKQTDDLKEFLQDKKANFKFLRTEYFQPFKNGDFRLQTSKFKLSSKLGDFNIQDLHQLYLYQIRFLLDQILPIQLKKSLQPQQQQQDDQQVYEQEMLKIRMIRGLFSHYKWQFYKKDLYDIFIYRCKMLKTIISNLPKSAQINMISERAEQIYQQNLFTNQKVMKQAEAHPYLFLLLHSQHFDKFLKIKENQYEYYGQSQNSQNQYNSLVHKPQSFQITSPFVPIQTFLKWIRSTQKYPIIDYISMMHKNKQDYLLISKKMNISSKNANKKAILLVDHCQLCPQIYEQQLSVKTVFISRLKRGTLSQMSQIFEQECTQNFLSDNQQESLQLLFQLSKFISSPSQEHYIFKEYKWVLQNFIKIQSITLKCQTQTIWQFLKILHKCITTNKNRVQQLKEKFPVKAQSNINWRLMYYMPVYRKNQKIYFANNLYSFIYVLNLYQDLQSQKWKMKIQPNQYQSIKQWSEFIDPTSKQNFITNLLFQLQSKTNRSLNTLQIQECINVRNDILEILNILTKTGGQKFRKQVFQAQLNKILTSLIPKDYSSMKYNQLFMEHVTTYNFKRIQKVYKTSKFLIDNQPIIIILSNQGINLYTSSPLKNQKLCRQNCKLLFVNFHESQKFIHVHGYGISSLQPEKRFLYSINLTINQKLEIYHQKTANNQIQEKWCQDQSKNQIISNKVKNYLDQFDVFAINQIHFALSHRKTSDVIINSLNNQIFVTLIQNKSKGYFFKTLSLIQSEDEQIKQIQSIILHPLLTQKQKDFHHFIILTSKNLIILHVLLEENQINLTSEIIYQAKKEFKLNSFQIQISQKDSNHYILIISQNNSIYPLSEICIGTFKIQQNTSLLLDIIQTVYQKQYVQCVGFHQQSQKLYWFNKKDDTMRSLKIQKGRKQMHLHQENIEQQQDYEQKYWIEMNGKSINIFKDCIFVTSRDNYLKKLRKLNNDNQLDKVENKFN